MDTLFSINFAWVVGVTISSIISLLIFLVVFRRKSGVVVSLILLTHVVLTSALILFKVYTPNPFKSHGVTFRIDTPGANGNYIEFTPIKTSEPKTILGPTVGTGFAELNFKDLDKDGTPEVIIETSRKALSISGELQPYYDKYVLKYNPSAAEISNTFYIIDQVHESSDDP